MNKLTKKYKVVHEGTKMVFPLTEEGDNAEVFPAVNATAVEFDTYSEAKAYVDEHNLVYEEHKYGEQSLWLIKAGVTKTKKRYACGVKWIND